MDFNRIQSSYDKDMGRCSGIDKFICPYCGAEYELHWEGETGSSWYIEDGVCPYCGWPTPTDDSDTYHYKKDEDKELEAPCPVCEVLVHSVGYTGKNDEIQKLSCGHWISKGWYDYAQAYKDFQIAKKNMSAGLQGIEELEDFIFRHPRALLSKNKNKEKKMLKNKPRNGETWSDIMSEEVGKVRAYIGYECAIPIPETTAHGLINAAYHGRDTTGHFINAVLSNDLRGAFARADHSNLEALHNIVMWVSNAMPYEVLADSHWPGYISLAEK